MIKKIIIELDKSSGQNKLTVNPENIKTVEELMGIIELAKIKIIKDHSNAEK